MATTCNLTPDGDYKRNYARGKKQGVEVVNLPGWGGPRHFERKTGYRQVIVSANGKDAGAYLHQKFRRLMPQPPPIRCRRLKRAGLAKMFGALGFTKGAEIGVSSGIHSEMLCQTIPDLELLCIDPWDAYFHFNQERLQKFHKIAIEKLKPFNATLIQKTGLEAALDVPDESLDFVYIDGDHRFDYVMQDIITWARKVRPGGIVAGHDYYRFSNGGVVDAVDVYTRVHAIHEWFVTDEREASWFWAKK
jgi:predicted O-methyltransferase YrrM